MRTLGTALAILSVFSAGFGLTLALWRGSKPILAFELFGFSWIMGAGFVSAALAVLGIVVSGSVLFATVAVGALGLGWYGFRRVGSAVQIETGWKLSPAWERWSILLLLIPIIYMGYASFRDALVWDGLLLWESKARHAFLAGGSLPASYFQDPTRSGYHTNYPQYLPFTELWVYLWVGDCDQTAIKPLFALFYAAGITLLWSNVLRLGGRVWVATVTALLPLFIPLLADHGLGLVHGYCDFILGAVYMAAVGALLVWRQEGVEGAWPMAVACTALLPWIKQEGVLLVASLLVVGTMVQGWRGWAGWKRTALLATPAVVGALAWALAMRCVHSNAQTDFLPFTWENFLVGLPRLWAVLYLMGAQLGALRNWTLLWFGVPLALVCLLWRRRAGSTGLGLAIIIPLVLYTIPYLFTRLDLIKHVATSMERLVLQTALVAVLVLGLALAGKRQAS